MLARIGSPMELADQLMGRGTMRQGLEAIPQMSLDSSV
jgi:hypothetical protein